MAEKPPLKTPCRALRLAELDLPNYRSHQKPEPRVNQSLSTVMPPPTARAKRLVEIFAEMMPPPERYNATSIKKPFRSSMNVQKPYLSTSKKQLKPLKKDHTVVRRALNFLSVNQMEDVQMHPKSQPITKKLLAPAKKNYGEEKKTGVAKLPINNQKPLSVPKRNDAKFQAPLLLNGAKNNMNSSVSQTNEHNYDLRSRTTISGISLSTSINKNALFTQYRNVDESFDASICEESSPQIIPVEKSFVDMREKSNKTTLDSSMSDLLCDMLVNTDLAAKSSISDKVHKIHEKIEENIMNANRQLDFLSSVSEEIAKNKKVLLSCIESNKQVLDMTSELLKFIQESEKTRIKTRTSIPISNKSAIRPTLRKIQNFDKSIDDLFLPDKNNVNKILPDITNMDVQGTSTINLDNKEQIFNLSDKENCPAQDLCIKKENVSLVVENSDANVTSDKLPQSTTRTYDLRMSVLKSNFEMNKWSVGIKITSPSIKKLSPKNKTVSPKNKSISQRSFKSQLGSPKNSKSMEMYKSLKDSVNFLKTPVGKGKYSRLNNNPALETPNTRSRNITSNNIKRQLESLYDS